MVQKRTIIDIESVDNDKHNAAIEKIKQVLSKDGIMCELQHQNKVW